MLGKGRPTHGSVPLPRSPGQSVQAVSGHLGNDHAERWSSRAVLGLAFRAKIAWRAL